MVDEKKDRPFAPKPTPMSESGKTKSDRPESAEEIGGRDGPDATRYGDWEKNGRCVDF